MWESKTSAHLLNLLALIKELEMKGVRPTTLTISLAQFQRLREESNCVDRIFGLDIKIKEFDKQAALGII